MSTFKEIRGTLIKSLSSDPSPIANGDIWYNSTSQVLKGVPAAPMVYLAVPTFPVTISSTPRSVYVDVINFVLLINL